MNSSPPSREQYSARLPALHFLCNLGWHFLSTQTCLALRGNTREVVMRPRLIEVLQRRRFEYKGQWFPLSPSAIDQIVRELSAMSLADGLMQTNKRLYSMLVLGITVTEFMPDGKKHQPTIAIIDWNDVDANIWDVTEALEVLSTHGNHSRTPDIVCYINGIPLVVCEIGNPSLASRSKVILEDGIRQHWRNQYHDEIPQLFIYAQLLISLSPDDGRYGTTLTPPYAWTSWREEEESDAQVLAWKNQSLSAATQTAIFAGKPLRIEQYFAKLWSGRQSLNGQDRLLAALLRPTRLLEFLRAYLLFDCKTRKIVARYQQFFAARVLLRRIRLRRIDGAREGGVVWHATGSGKRFSMVYLSRALLLCEAYQSCRIFVITDCDDHEESLLRNLIQCGVSGSAIAPAKEHEKSHIGSGRELAKCIGQGNERLIFTALHKFATALQLPECYNSSADLLVLIDEGHRLHGGHTYERMRKVLPRASYVLFTGVPLFQQEKTSGKYGPILHAYPLQRAVEDRMVLPLLYEQRHPKLQQGQEAADRLAWIAEDIAQHFSEHIKKRHSGLKGQIATSSKADAVRYQHYLASTGLISSTILMSAPEHREGYMPRNETTSPEVLAWWQAHVGQHQEEYERTTLRAFASDSGPDLLIVVDRLLSRFDEPRNSVLYIDKKMDMPALIQATTRINRPHPEKCYGILIDYYGQLSGLDTEKTHEQKIFNGYALSDIAGLYCSFESQYQRLPALHRALWSCFPAARHKLDRERFRQTLLPRYTEDAYGHSQDTRLQRREDFYVALAQFDMYLQIALSSQNYDQWRHFDADKLEQYQRDLQFFMALRTTVRRDVLETLDYPSSERHLRRGIDQQAIERGKHEVRQAEEAYQIQQSADTIAQDWPEEKMRNEIALLRSRLKKSISQELADDPYAQKTFTEQLKQTLSNSDLMGEDPFRQFSYLKKFEYQLTHRILDGVPLVLGKNQRARACFGLIRLSLGEAVFAETDNNRLIKDVVEIDRMIDLAMTEHSLNPQNIAAVMRQNLLPVLFALLGLEQAKQVIEQIIEITLTGRDD